MFFLEIMEFMRVVRPLKLFKEERWSGYGWFNKEMNLQYGYIEAKNAYGGYVKVTVVTDSDEAPFPNCIKLGLVSNFYDVTHDPDLWKSKKGDAPEGFTHAWYSPFEAATSGYRIYRDASGNPIMVTLVSSDGEGYCREVVDLRYMGLVINDKK